MSAARPRYLTKSRFKLAVECPTKLYYTGKPEFLDTAQDDSFLAALAEGGHQVGALACLMIPGGTLVDDPTHAEQLARTQALLQQDAVVIYEAALAAGDLFIRVDILRKRGREIELIEVKAKSYDPAEHGDLRLKRKAGIQSDFLPYVQDIAFQREVAARALPGHTLRAFLMLVDQSAVCSVDGLNRRFRLRRQGARASVEVAPGTGAASLGAPILRLLPVDALCDAIVRGTLPLAGQVAPFAEAVAAYAAAYRDDRRLDPVPSAACGACTFRAPTPPRAGEPRSGFHECWAQAFGWSDADFAQGTVLDVWHFRKKNALIRERRLRPSDVTAQDLGHDGSAPGPAGMTRKHRQWFQCQGGWPGGGAFHLDAAGLRAAMAGWRWPLHFIDFETCAPAIPFFAGWRPYEVVAFQFSHHVLHDDGRVEHRTQFLETTVGADPTLAFVRALQAALAGDDGTIFRWATHENSVLDSLRARLLALTPPPADLAGLVAFIESITTRTEGRVDIAGPRAMVDLCRLAEQFYFHPATQASSSLKRVLPALMQSADVLRTTYGQPVYGTAAMPSLNHAAPVAWWRSEGGQVLDPYQLLPPVFSDVPRAEVEAFDADAEARLAEGGAAAAAYVRLQSEALPAAERDAINAALLRYCELDTLAMVMVVQAWRAEMATRVAARSSGTAA